MAEAEKYFSGDYKKLTDEELAELYEQSILKFSYDGELLEKNDYFSYKDGKFRTIQKAWVSDGQLNMLERNISRSGSESNYLLNGKELTVPQSRWNNEEDMNISDMYTTNGYQIFNLYGFYSGAFQKRFSL